MLAATALAALDPPGSDPAGRRQAAAAIRSWPATSATLRPSRARRTCTPTSSTFYVEGELPEPWDHGTARDTKWLLAEERRLLRVLTAARRRQQREARRAA